MVTSVNPLSIGTPISTGQIDENYIISVDVSIPYLSGHPFLQVLHENKEKLVISVVSIPYLSGHPFLQESQVLLLSDSRVNPLSIGTPISTFVFAEQNHLIINFVSIPYLSGHPFLRFGKSEIIIIN